MGWFVDSCFEGEKIGAYSKIKEKSLQEAFVESKFRESRDQNYNLSYLSGADRLKAIKGLEVLNIEINKLEKL